MDPDLIERSADPSEQGLVRSLSLTDPQLIELFARQAPDAVAWLRGLGARFDFLPTQFLTKSQPRLLPVGGGEALVNVLAARAQALGVSFHYQTTAESLLLNDRGAVVGLRARQGSGLLQFHGPVVLACGGFQGNT
jgi:tricarballylate dehydrogenase